MKTCLEVRQRTLGREREIAAGVRMVDRKRDIGNEDIECNKLHGGNASPSAQIDTTQLKSWSKKIHKLTRAGVPMFEVRQVSDASSSYVEAHVIGCAQESLRLAEGHP
jgi:hypothetical protein